MKSWLRAHGRLSGSAAASWSRPAGCRSTCRRWPPRAPPGRSPPTRSRCSPRSPPRERWTRPPPQGIDLAAIEAVLAAVAVEAPHRDLQKAVGATTWPHSTPTAPNPTPPRAGRCRSPSTPTAAVTGRFSSTLVGGEKVATALESIAAADRCAGDDRTRAQQPRRRPGPAGRPRPGLRRAAGPAHRQAARRGHYRHRGPGRPARARRGAPPAWAPASPPPGCGCWPATATSPAS